MLVAPATFNTINKWALGISDNLALGILNEALGNEALGLELPILVSPYLKQTLTAQPAYNRHVPLLTDAGVAFTPAETLRPIAAGDHFRWQRLSEEVWLLRS